MTDQLERLRNNALDTEIAAKDAAADCIATKRRLDEARQQHLTALHVYLTALEATAAMLDSGADLEST